MIAITGASGNLGKATLSFLLLQTSPENIRAVVRNPDKMQAFAQTGIQILAADYTDPPSLWTAFQGVHTLLLISASDMGASAAQQELQAVQAAKDAGVAYIVYTSTLKAEEDIHFLAAATCLQTEKAIMASGIGYTIFRNSMYMETIPLFIGDAINDGQIFYPGAQGKVSFVSRLDIAEALGHVLRQHDTQNKVYEITGSEALSFGDIAALLAVEKGLPATYTDMEVHSYQQALAAYGLPPDDIRFYLSMAAAIRAKAFAFTDNSLEQLLGRTRLKLSTYLQAL